MTHKQKSKRERILQATWKLIRHYGYAKTTIGDIAREAGIGKGTVYLYFKSKADIILALVDRTNERITLDLEKIASGGESPEIRMRECLLHRILAIFDIVRKYPHGEDVITAIKPEIVGRIKGFVRRQGKLLGGIIIEGVSLGHFETAEPEKSGLLLADLFETFTPPYYRFATRKSFERFANGVLDLVLAGLKKNVRTDFVETIKKKVKRKSNQWRKHGKKRNVT